MGGSTVKTMKKCQMEKLVELVRKWCANTSHTYCLLFLYMLLFTEVCVFVVFAVVHVAGVWAYFHTRLVGIL